MNNLSRIPGSRVIDAGKRAAVQEHMTMVRGLLHVTLVTTHEDTPRR